MNKNTLIYDVSTLYHGFYKTSARSGIYFCALNILKELVNHSADFNLILYCSVNNLIEVKKVLQKEFPEKSFTIISDYPLFKFNLWFYGLKYKRREIKEEENNKLVRFLKKTLLKLIILFATPVSSILLRIAGLNDNAKFTKNDIFLSPAYTVPNKFSTCTKFTVLHDTIPLIYPKNPLISNKKCWYSQLISSINSKDYYFANSECTRNDFLKFFPQINEKKIFTCLHACSDIFKPKACSNDIKEKYNIPSDKKYIFSLCTLEPRKNLIRAVKTFIQFIKKNNIQDVVFVLGGGHWESFISQLENETENLGNYKNSIIKIGYVEDEDLPSLYTGAEWFVYTSEYEGFGVPPLEAMSCGCPVIVSNNSSLPEVVGDTGLSIDYKSDDEHIKAYEKYYFDSELRKENSMKGLKRANDFSWEKCVDEMLTHINIITKHND